MPLPALTAIQVLDGKQLLTRNMQPPSVKWVWASVKAEAQMYPNHKEPARPGGLVTRSYQPSALDSTPKSSGVPLTQSWFMPCPASQHYAVTNSCLPSSLLTVSGQ